MVGHVKKHTGILVFLISFSLFYFGASDRPLSVPDEGRYVEIPREMAQANDFITPRLNGIKYFEKPPLFYWAQAGLIKLLGTHASYMRLLPALAGALSVFFVYLCVSLFFTQAAGLWASGVLSTTFLHFGLSHIIVIDGLFSALLTAAFCCFLIGMHETTRPQRRKWAWGTSALLALAVLAKGFVALVLFCGVGFIWLFLSGTYKRMRPLFLPSSLLLFLLIILPWHLLVQMRNPEFFDFYIIHEHFLRYLTKAHCRYQPFHFFIPIVLLGFMPWTIFFMLGIKDLFQSRRLYTPKQTHFLLFCVTWTLFIFVFFSLSSSKLVTYILPVFPAMAMITGVYIHKGLTLQKSFKSGIYGYSLTALLVVVVYFAWKHDIPAPAYETYLPYIRLLIATFILAAIIPPLILNFKTPKASLISIALITLGQFAVMTVAVQGGIGRSVKKSYEKMRQEMPLNTEPYSYHHYFQDLPVYANHTVKTVRYEGEMLFGHTLEPHNGILISEEIFWTHWFSPSNMCVFFHKEVEKTFFTNILTQKVKTISSPDALRPQQSAPYVLWQEPAIQVLCNCAPSNIPEKNTLKK